MAKEITTSIWCDRHMLTEERVPGDTHRIQVDNNRQPVELDACKDCWEELAGPLLAFLDELNPRLTKIPDGKHAPVKGHLGEVRCPECGKRMTSRSGIVGHMKSLHGKDLNAWESEQGKTIDGRILQYKCDWKGCGMTFASGQGLGTHQTRKGHREAA